MFYAYDRKHTADDICSCNQKTYKYKEFWGKKFWFYWRKRPRQDQSQHCRRSEGGCNLDDLQISASLSWSLFHWESWPSSPSLTFFIMTITEIFPDNHSSPIPVCKAPVSGQCTARVIGVFDGRHLRLLLCLSQTSRRASSWPSPSSSSSHWKLPQRLPPQGQRRWTSKRLWRIPSTEELTDHTRLQHHQPMDRMTKGTVEKRCVFVFFMVIIIDHGRHNYHGYHHHHLYDIDKRNLSDEE